MQLRTTALFCDDARRDEFGSFTIVGAYAGVINLVPSRKNRKIGNFITIENFPTGQYEVRFIVQFTPDKGGETEILVDQYRTIEGDPDAAMVLNPMGLPLLMEEDGILALNMTINGGEPLELCRVQILHYDVDFDEDDDVELIERELS